jgi:outer membrane protein OmpA-like peptidoglycan-associated protein
MPSLNGNSGDIVRADTSSFLAALAALIALAGSGGAAAADPEACKPPAWALQAPAGYRIDSCQTHAWIETDVEVASGSKKVAGSSSAVSYILAEGAKDHAAEEIRRFYAAAGRKAGAALKSVDEGYNAALQKQSPAGEEWYLYTHGAGNEQSTGSFTLTTLHVEPLRQEVTAQAMSAPLSRKPGCADPPWLKKQFDYFKRASCEYKDANELELSLAAGSKTVSGRYLEVSYELSDAKRDPAARAVLLNYVAALQAIGARLVSDPDDGSNGTLLQQTPYGQIWYIYEHGGGNEASTESYTLKTLQVDAFPQEVVAQAVSGPLAQSGAHCADPPWLKKQFDYFRIEDCGYRDLDQVVVDLAGGKPKTLAGRYFEITYQLTDEKRTPAALTVKKNYVNALQAIGAKLVSQPDDIYTAVLTQKTSAGEFWYIYRHGSGNEGATGSYSLLTVEVGGPPPKSCTLEVYGMSFDFDKASLRPDSEPVLQQLQAMFAADPAFRAEVGGHTDNVGKADYNLKLSADRAGTVKAWLVAHGVEAGRITAAGYGDTRPLVPNTSDQNRFRNRRVELKRSNCK